MQAIEAILSWFYTMDDVEDFASPPLHSNLLSLCFRWK